MFIRVILVVIIMVSTFSYRLSGKKNSLECHNGRLPKLLSDINRPTANQMKYGTNIVKNSHVVKTML